MSNIAAFFRANTGALVVTMLLTMGTIVFGSVALLMSRSGTSLKPIIFVAGFFLIILAPQAVWHYSQAFGWIERDDLAWVPSGSGAAQWRANDDLLEVKDGRFARPADIYGPAYDKDLVSDLRERMAQVFGGAQAAEMAALRTGGMTVLARFSSPDDALAAANAYSNAMAGHFPQPDANGIHMVPRATDVMAIIVAGRILVAYSAPDSTAVRKLWAESPIVTMASPEKDAQASEAGAKKISRAKFGLIAMVLTLILAVGWFFRMSAWASQSEPGVGVTPVSPTTLRERLMAVNALDVPFSVQPSPDDPSVLIGTWRYADAKWIDLARAHGMKRTYRILMKLDEANNIVRPTEQTGALDWSAGADGGSMQWATQRGIIFFQYETVRVFGLQIDSQNRLTPNLSYKYTFNLQEMKAPLIDAVTKSGWTWRPTMLHGPRWIAWLTE